MQKLTKREQKNLNAQLLKHINEGDLSSVHQDIAQGANVNCQNCTPLIQACSKGYTEIADVLIEHGAIINFLFERALFYATQHGHFDTVQLLVNKGADCMVKSRYIINAAVEHGFFDIFKYYVDVLENHCKSGKNDYTQLEYFLIDSLEFSCKYGHLDITRYLVEERQVNFSHNNEYALRLAISYRHLDTVRYLLDKGANLHAYDECATIIASKNDDIPILELLVQRGADLYLIKKCGVPEVKLWATEQIMHILSERLEESAYQKGRQVSRSSTHKI